MLRPVIFLLTLLSTPLIVVAQVSNNSCSNAIPICPGEVISSDNIGATATICPGCEDDFNFCFATDNTVWFSFTTNAIGGNVQVDIFNLIFESNPGQDNELQATIIETAIPCNAPSYLAVGNCVSNAAGNFTLNAAALAPNTTYMLVVDGDNNGAGITDPAECSFQISISGAGVDHIPPGISVMQSSSAICQNEVVYFEASLSDCPDTGNFEWYVNGALVAVTATPVFQTSGLVDGDLVHVETSCYALCPEIVGVDAIPVSVFSFPIYAGPDLTIAPGTTVTLNGQTTAPVFEWSPSYLFSDPFNLTTLCFPDETVTLTLSATQNGCTLSDYVVVTVLDDLDIPNTFSPNNDLINDTWVIKGIEKYPNNVVSIYDRWGQSVYQTTGYSKVKAWDGQAKARQVSESVYFYIIDLENNGEQILKGSLTVIH